MYTYLCVDNVYIYSNLCISVKLDEIRFDYK